MNYYRDQIGSVRMVTKYDTADDGIKTVWKGDYTPYGEILTEDYGMNWLPLKTFALHEYDRETGLYYAQARWYDPETSQFVSEDGAQDGLNWYGYCGDRPLGNVDPSGLLWGSENYADSHYKETHSYAGGGGGGSTVTPHNTNIPTVTPKDMTFKEWCDYVQKVHELHGYDADPNSPEFGLGYSYGKNWKGWDVLSQLGYKVPSSQIIKNLDPDKMVVLEVGEALM